MSVALIASRVKGGMESLSQKRKKPQQAQFLCILLVWTNIYLTKTALYTVHTYRIHTQR